MTYGGEEMTRRDKGNRPSRVKSLADWDAPATRSETQAALRELGSVVLAALVVCGLVAAWQTARAFGVIS